jgi:hypothetical protein
VFLTAPCVPQPRAAEVGKSVYLSAQFDPHVLKQLALEESPLQHHGQGLHTSASTLSQMTFPKSQN